jgi:hypothetical protein
VSGAELLELEPRLLELDASLLGAGGELSLLGLQVVDGVLVLHLLVAQLAQHARHVEREDDVALLDLDAIGQERQNLSTHLGYDGLRLGGLEHSHHCHCDFELGPRRLRGGDLRLLGGALGARATLDRQAEHPDPDGEERSDEDERRQAAGQHSQASHFVPPRSDERTSSSGGSVQATLSPARSSPSITTSRSLRAPGWTGTVS